MHKLKMLTTLLAITISSVSYANSCTRHIYNNSSYPWIVQFYPGKGDVHFNKGTLCQNKKNGPCKVEVKRKSVEIEYTSTYGLAKGRISLTKLSPKPVTLSFDYLSYSAPGFCPAINDNEGKTHGIYLNEPANGDITFGSIEK